MKPTGLFLSGHSLADEGNMSKHSPAVPTIGFNGIFPQKHWFTKELTLQPGCSMVFEGHTVDNSLGGFLSKVNPVNPVNPSIALR